MSTAHMQLSAFRVTNFRSVKDSGWIDTSEITSLIGTNESGKTNLLLPLWKLNPAKEGEIKLLSDAPRKDYNAYRTMTGKPVFICGRFVLSEPLAASVAAETNKTADQVRVVEVSRDFNGNRTIHFPNAQADSRIDVAAMKAILDEAVADISKAGTSGKGDEALKAELLRRLREAGTTLDGFDGPIGAEEVTALQQSIDLAAIKSASARSTVGPRFGQLVDTLAEYAETFTKPGPDDNEDVIKLVIEHLPAFVYYTTYGNLDTEIYLPHVIEDLKRTDLTGKAEARARTLRVLFDFVRLKPEEILELGKDWDEKQGKPDEAQIQALNEKKKERSVLLQSAGTELTTKFREWWRQGEYRIRFEADGKHFRIWVSDDKRPEEIELEGRSTGLQWFLSFYLIFLVESRSAHNGAILLLDEPGHSLHPLAQKDLAVFFENLSGKNQLLYTTHSPFLVDADHLDRVRAVFVDGAGLTAVSTNLRASTSAAESKSIYPVHAALGLSVSDTLFQGCRAIVVEGVSDQLYLSAMKILLISAGRIQPARELLFVPTTGAKAIKTVAAILGGKDSDLPVVLCDGDNAGAILAKTLKDEMYADAADRVILATDVSSVKDAEIEDLLPHFFLGPIIDRYLRGPDESPFSSDEKAGGIVQQVKAYAKKHSLTLVEGWKVEVARLAKGKLPANAATDSTWKATIDMWQTLFERLMVATPTVAGAAARG
ncbi:MAG: putative ATP-dependent family endonuclease [Gemmataceae bacterium]|nr:putative ATP-dependent family endonuclease [Gemmataceae bacterium]